MQCRLFLACVLSLILLSPTVTFAEFSGPVVSVLDGDTIEVLHNTHTERVRLSGIDCPEKGQAYGQKASQGYDKYKRTLADVLLPDGTNVNHTLVKDG